MLRYLQLGEISAVGGHGGLSAGHQHPAAAALVACHCILSPLSIAGVGGHGPGMGDWHPAARRAAAARRQRAGLHEGAGAALPECCSPYIMAGAAAVDGRVPAACLLPQPAQQLAVLGCRASCRRCRPCNTPACSSVDQQLVQSAARSISGSIYRQLNQSACYWHRLQVCDCLVSSAGGKDARFCGMLMGELHGGSAPNTHRIFPFLHCAARCTCSPCCAVARGCGMRMGELHGG